MTEVRFYDTVDDSLLKFAVIIACSKGRWVFCKHKERDTYEIPGGHREPGENILDTAKRELYEETGAVKYSIKPICVYSVTAPNEFDGVETFGGLYFADIEEFEEETGIKVNYTTYSTNEELYNKLKNSNDSYDVVVPSDYMISKLIREKMLLELNFDNIPNYKYINKRFKNLSCDPDGKYTVCYNWGVTAMVYDKTKVKTKPTSWDALWDKNLKGDILMINNSRDAMAIAMQTLGIDPSKCTKADIDKASKKLKEQKPLLKKYVMDQVFNDMEGGQAAIAPYYAGDIAMMMEENSNLDYALPSDGSNLFYDGFCIPTCSKNKECCP